MARSNYKMDTVGTGGLMRSSELHRLVDEVARDAIPFAQSISPVESGEYRDSFRVESGEETIARERRAVAYLANDAPHAAAVEARNHVLSRTIDHIEAGG